MLSQLKIVFIGLVFAIFLLSNPACDDSPDRAAPGHAGAEPGDAHSEHARPEPDQDHADAEANAPRQQRLGFGERIEVFVDFPRLVAGQHESWAVHATKLEDYSPLADATVAVLLHASGTPGERWETSQASRPGLFPIDVSPEHSGSRKLSVRVETDAFEERVALDEVQVFASETDAARAQIDQSAGDIALSKEQQWTLDFGVVQAQTRRLRPSLPVNARIRPSDDAAVTLTSPFSGLLAAPTGGLPTLGTHVSAGDVVAYVVPSLEPGAVSELRARVRQAQVALERAEREVERVEGLVADGALPAKRLRDAESDAEIARAELERAQNRLQQYQGLASPGGSSNGRVAVRSPFDGRVARRSAVAGEVVEQGAALLRVVDETRLWLEAQVPEADVPHLAEPTGAWFRSAPAAPVVTIGPDGSGALVGLGNSIHPETRTLPLIFAIGEHAARASLRPGAFVKAHIYAGPAREVLAVPEAAVLEEKGAFVVFVVRGGESFERRPVRIGIRERGWVEVASGLAPEERVVSRGAYYVKLAGTAAGSVGHGHAH